MLTPADIKHRTLKTTMGGYNKRDTDEFLASILESFEELSTENTRLKENLTSLSEGIQYYKNLEDNLQKALVLAEKTSEETKNAAKAEAANIVSLAKKEAEDIVSKAKKEADVFIGNAKIEFDKKVTDAQKKYEEINSRLSVLSSSYEEYKCKIRSLIKEQLDFVDGEASSPKIPEDLIPGDEILDINNHEKDDLEKEYKDDTIVEISDEPNTTTEVEINTNLEDISEPDKSISTIGAKSSDVMKEQTFVWQSVDDEDFANEEKEIAFTEENEFSKNIDMSESTDKDVEKSKDIEEIKSESKYDKKNTETEIKNETEVDNIETSIKNRDNEEDIIVENIMKTPTVDASKADVSNTVFPASMPEDNSVSYLSSNSTGSEEKKNPFTFINLD